MLRQVAPTSEVFKEGRFHTVQACSHFYPESDPSLWVLLNLVQL